MKRSIALVFCVLALVAAGCSSTPDEPAGPGTGPQPVGDDWWNNPSNITNYLAAVGSSPIMSEYDVNGARQSAAVDGRNELAASINAKIQSLHENWSKRCGDLTDKETFSSYMNDERFVRQMVDQHVRGAWVAKYHRDGNTMYALVVLKNVSAFFDDVVKQDSDRIKKDETMLKTDAMKEMARNRLDEMIKEEKEKIAQNQNKVLEQLRGEPQ